MTRFISQTDEGRKLYEEYVGAGPAKRPSGTPSLSSTTITHPMERLSKLFHDHPELHATYRGQFSDAPLMGQARVMVATEAQPIVDLFKQDGKSEREALLRVYELVPGLYAIRRELLNAASAGPAIAWRLLKEAHPERLRRTAALAVEAGGGRASPAA